MAHFQSRLPQVAAEISPRTRAVIAEIAEAVEERAKEKVPKVTGRLHDQIHTEYDEALGAYEVLAGDAREKDFAFYGHIVEHGSVVASPHPFMVPAAEEVRGEMGVIGREGFAGL